MSMINEQVRRLREFAKTLKYADEYNLVNGAADTIGELSAKLHNSQMERSSQYYNGGWIPVSERLPKEHGGYLVTVKYGYVTRALWVGDAENWKGVIAWMPLPQPYLPDINIGNMSEIPKGAEGSE